MQVFLSLTPHTHTHILQWVSIVGRAQHHDSCKQSVACARGFHFPGQAVCLHCNGVYARWEDKKWRIIVCVCVYWKTGLKNVLYWWKLRSNPWKRSVCIYVCMCVCADLTRTSSLFLLLWSTCQKRKKKGKGTFVRMCVNRTSGMFTSRWSTCQVRGKERKKKKKYVCVCVCVCVRISPRQAVCLKWHVPGKVKENKKKKGGVCIFVG